MRNIGPGKAPVKRIRKIAEKSIGTRVSISWACTEPCADRLLISSGQPNESQSAVASRFLVLSGRFRSQARSPSGDRSRFCAKPDAAAPLRRSDYNPVAPRRRPSGASAVANATVDSEKAGDSIEWHNGRRRSSQRLALSAMNMALETCGIRDRFDFLQASGIPVCSSCLRGAPAAKCKTRNLR
jgi:hypothetical protein